MQTNDSPMDRYKERTKARAKPRGSRYDVVMAIHEEIAAGTKELKALAYRGLRTD